MGHILSLISDPLQAGPDSFKDHITMFDGQLWVSYPPQEYRRIAGIYFHLNFDDPESLERELKHHGMAGIIVWNPTYHLWGEKTKNWNYDGSGYPNGDDYEPGTLYLVGKDRITTSIVERGRYCCSAVFPESLSWIVGLSLGSDALRRLVNVHRPGFPHREIEQKVEEAKKTK